MSHDPIAAGVRADAPRLQVARQIFTAFLRLGLTAFGGPIAHLGYFRQEFVVRRRWLSEEAYADIVALCQFLPGPASSQVGIAVGLLRGGMAGALAAWLGFTLPSAIALVLLGTALTAIAGFIGTEWLHGLKLVAVAVVAQALWGMGRTLSPDRLRATIAALAALVVSIWPSTTGQIGAIVAAGITGALCLPVPPPIGATSHVVPISQRAGTVLLLAFFSLLVGLPAIATASGSYLAQLFDSFYRSGALVFGGGHVVLPLLQAEVVPRGWISDDVFLAGYGMAQAVPGPLFTFAAFLGAVSTRSPAGWPGAAAALVAIFLPGMLLVLGTLPFWDRLRRYARMRQVMAGINAAVVGLLLAALYNPVWTSAVTTRIDFGLVVVAFLALTWWKVPPWLVVVVAALVAGAGIAR